MFSRKNCANGNACQTDYLAFHNALTVQCRFIKKTGADSNLENIMGSMPIKGLIIKTCWPLMLSLLMNNLFHLVNSIFVSRLGEAALTAISLSVPIMTLLAALGSGIAVGLNAVISKAMGEKNEEEVQAVIRTSLFLAVVSYGLIMLGGFFAVRPYFLTQTDNMEIIQLGVDYLGTYMVLSCGLMFQWVFDRLLISTGKSQYFLITLSSAAIINIILDPIFIFGYLGFPKMGIRGAAIATVIAQLVGAILGLVLNITRNKELHMKLSFSPNFATMRRMLAIGIPTAMIQGFASIMAVVVNLILIGFSSTAVALYVVILRILGIIQIIPFGISLGVIPIVAYNLGAKNKQRIIDTVKYSQIYALIGSAAGMAVLMLVPKLIIGIFNPSDEMVHMAIPAIRIMSILLPLSSISIIITSVFQGLGNARLSMYLSLSRQIVILIPVLYLLSLSRTLDLVWLAFPVTELLSLAIAALLYLSIKKNIIDLIEEKQVISS